LRSGLPKIVVICDCLLFIKWLNWGWNIRCQGEFFGPLTCEIKEIKCEKTSRQVAGLPSKELIALYL
jgi:hypothetical protein